MCLISPLYCHLHYPYIPVSIIYMKSLSSKPLLGHCSNSVAMIVERKPEAGHPEEETTADQDRVQLGAVLLQVHSPFYSN